MKARWVVKFKPTGTYMSYLDLQPRPHCVAVDMDWTKDRSKALRFKNLTGAFAARELTGSLEVGVFRLRGIK